MDDGDVREPVNPNTRIRAHVVFADQAWEVRVLGQTRSRHRNQPVAIDAARSSLEDVGGGILVVHDRSGDIRAIDVD